MAHSIKYNFLLNASYQLLLIFLPLITSPYLSRVLGSQGVGEYSYTYSIANFFVMFAMLGLSTYGVRTIAEHKSDREDLSQTFWDVFAVQVCVGLVVLVAYIFYLNVILDGAHGYSWFWIFWIVSAPLDITWLFFGVEEFKSPTIRSIVVKLCCLAAIFLFVKSKSDVGIYVAIMSLSFLLSQVLLWPFVPKFVRFKKPNLSNFWHHLKPNLVLFAPVIAISLYTTLDKVILGLLSDMHQVGYFDYSEKMSKIPLALITALGTVMLPRMSAKIAAGEKESAFSLLNSTMWIAQVASWLMVCVIASIAPEFCPVFFGEEYTSCSSLMRILSLVIPLIAATNVIGQQFLLPAKRDNAYTASVFIGSVVNIPLALVLIPHLAAAGSAISTVAAELAVLVAQCVFARKQLPIRSYLVSSLPFAVLAIVCIVLCRFVASLIVGMFGVSVVALLIEIVLSGVLYCAASLVFCVVTKNGFYKQVRASLNE